MSSAATPEAKKDPIKLLRMSGATVLSGQGGEYAASPELRESLCLTRERSELVLTVLNGQEASVAVLSYKERLRSRGVNISTMRSRRVSIQMLRRLYEELDGGNVQAQSQDSAEGASSRQLDVIRLIRDAVGRKASDIHITIHKNFGTIAFRIHGEMIKVQELSATACQEMCSAIYQSMCDVADETYKPHQFQDARIRASFVKKIGLYGTRVASSPIDDGSRMVIRLLYDSGNHIPSLDDLGYLPEQKELINQMLAQTSGINVLSGVTGSGKSTTLVSVISSVIADARNSGPSKMDNESEEYWGISVVTLEDPPEYTIPGAIQIPLGADKSDEETIRLAWTKAISSLMRQDPDVMMIGEIRDPGSARAAFDAAMTGHGVWTTVHTTDALGIMARLSALNVPNDRLLDPEIVTGLINQSLAQRLCPHCSLKWEDARDKVEARTRARVEAYCQTDRVRLRGPGCEHCSHGITGRVVIAETIMPNLPFMEVFQDKGKARAKLYWIQEMHGITKCMAMIRRINEGLIDPQEAEHSVCALNNDLLKMGLDYSHDGDFAWGQYIVLPEIPGQTRAPFVEPKRRDATQEGKPQRLAQRRGARRGRQGLGSRFGARRVVHGAAAQPQAAGSPRLALCD